MKPLYLRDIGHFDLLVNRCLRERCGELNVHGFYHQLKSAGEIQIDRQRLRAWFHWECKRCGSEHSRRFRLTTGRKQPRLRLFRWLDWSKAVIDVAALFPWS